MNRRVGFYLIALFSMIAVAGCGVFPRLHGAFEQSFVRIYLVNTSTTKYVSPNPGLCPQGLQNLPHFFVRTPPLLAPGESVAITTVELAGPRGVCCGNPTDFMIGLCGWKYGTDPNALASCADRYGGLIGAQFNCGDTVILRWTDTGADIGTWSSEVLPARGNPVTTQPFMALPPPEGGSCQQ